MSQLSPEDGRAIDAILMSGNTKSSSPGLAGYGTPGTRIDAAAKVLSLLDAMPTEKLPGSLADRTVQFVMNHRGPRGDDPRQPVEQPGA